MRAHAGRGIAEEIGWTDFTFEHIGSIVYDRHVLGDRENHLFHVFNVQSAQPFLINDEAVEVRHILRAEYEKMLREEAHMFGAPHHFVEQSFADFLRNSVA